MLPRYSRCVSSVSLSSCSVPLTIAQFHTLTSISTNSIPQSLPCPPARSFSKKTPDLGSTVRLVSHSGSKPAVKIEVDVKKLLSNNTQTRKDKKREERHVDRDADEDDGAESGEADPERRRETDIEDEAAFPGENLSKSDRQKLIEKAKRQAKLLASMKLSGKQAHVQAKKKLKAEELEIFKEAKGKAASKGSVTGAGEEEEQEKKERVIKTIYLNTAIPFDSVLVIDSEGKRIGLQPTKQAVQAANAADFDLMLMTPIEQRENPVVKWINYKEFKRAEREQKAKLTKNARAVKMKELTIRPQIGDHDFDIKMNQAKKFLHRGNMVRFSYTSTLAVEKEFYMPLFRRIQSALNGIGQSDDIEEEENYCTFYMSKTMRAEMKKQSNTNTNTSNESSGKQAQSARDEDDVEADQDEDGPREGESEDDYYRRLEREEMARKKAEEEKQARMAEAKATAAAMKKAGTGAGPASGSTNQK